MTATLISLTLIFVELSLIAFGGGNAVLPEMQRRVVEVQHWMSASEFSALFALAQAAPGPNMMIVPLIGWHVAGLSGLVVTSIAKFVPSSLITAGAFTLWERFKDRPWRRVVQGGLAPMTAGLVTASAAVITQASATGPLLIAITVVTALVTARTKIHPLLVLGAGALVGMIGL
ncbi:chromate transporter [Allorhizobium taibaishanense]|uniref:Chromate transporter n=1 Tax=Allorhizobium taibaishanense TaxID=887144 RepID=A0A1Q9A8M2_9HYPH|nr:chromate transporter [Allorhizobium taibaishanense]MBB4009527.1 chromate transporter [Allorhizobium taibaishanense]OLP50939.1 chromate transporter [Allorhizobium taibaishanense]